MLSHPEFAKPPAPPPTDRYREQVMKRARRLAATGGPALLFPPEFGGLGRVGAAITSFETLAHSDLSLLVKCGVQLVPFLPSATYCFVGATLAPRPDGVGGRVGDLLVTYPSASGAGRRRRIPFDVENGRHVGGIDHMRLLNHPAVYDQLRNWLGRDPPERSP